MNQPAVGLKALQVLTVRFSVCGVGPDLAGLTLAQACGPFVFLRRLARGANA